MSKCEQSWEKNGMTYICQFQFGNKHDASYMMGEQEITYNKRLMEYTEEINKTLADGQRASHGACKHCVGIYLK